MEITKNQLEKFYIQEKQSVKQIGLVLCKSPKQISRLLKKFEIPTRPFSTKGLKPRLGAVLSQKTKDKIALAHTGKKLSLEHRNKVIKTLNYGKGENNSCWKGGRTISKEGYVLVRIDGIYVKEHRYVMSLELKRDLRSDEHIHHINRNKQDNRITNLLLISNSEHLSLHHGTPEGRKIKSIQTKEVRAKKFWSTKKKNIIS